MRARVREARASLLSKMRSTVSDLSSLRSARASVSRHRARRRFMRSRPLAPAVATVGAGGAKSGGLGLIAHGKRERAENDVVRQFHCTRPLRKGANLHLTTVHQCASFHLKEAHSFPNISNRLLRHLYN